jgi:hypothetical protein
MPSLLRESKQRIASFLWLICVLISVSLHCSNALKVSDGELQFPRRERRNLSSKQATKDAKDAEEIKFETSCKDILAPDNENKSLTQSRYAEFLIEYCSSSEYKGPACISSDNNRTFDTLDFDFQVAFVSKSCPNDDPVKQLHCIESLIGREEEIFYGGDDIDELCIASFNLLLSSNMIDILKRIVGKKGK